MATGIKNKPPGPGKYVYTYPLCVMSLDPDGTMHCGRMDIYMQGAEGSVTGLTTPIVFPKAVPGQVCRAAQWVGWKRLATTKDKAVVRPGRVIGKVLGASNSVVPWMMYSSRIPTFAKPASGRFWTYRKGAGS